MTDDYYVYIVDLPPGVNEMITPCQGGYTVYIDKKLSHEEMVKAFDHAVSHHDDFESEKTADQIEAERHG